MVDSRLFGSRKDTMKLMTEEIERILERHPYGSQDEAGPDAKVIVKYFGGSAATWLITEGEKQRNRNNNDFLSDASAWISGVSLVIDGGLMNRI